MSRYGLTGPKKPGLKQDLQWNRSCMLRIGERLMRAGSEGNLVQRPAPVQTDGLQQRTNGTTLLNEHSVKSTKGMSFIRVNTDDLSHLVCIIHLQYTLNLGLC